METKTVKLEEVCEIRRGSSPRPISNFISKNSEMPWVKISDATSTNSKVISETSEFIKLEGVDKSVIVQKGDLILSNSGTAGLPKFMGIQACIHDGWQVLRNLKGITSDYLYYSLIYIRSYLLHHAYDSVMKNLTLDMVRNAEVRLPPLSEQKAIAHILGTLDDKIELNRQMNETLETMAQALFKSWFVDFDPVIDNALLAGNDIPDDLAERTELRQAQLDSGQAYTNSDINDLFPSDFEFTEELGWIPKGWEVSNINNEFEVTMGQSPPGSSYNEEQEGIAFFQGSTDFGFRYPTNRIYTTEPKRLADKDDTLVSVRAPVGTVNMATQKCCIGRGLSAVRHKSGNRSYTYYSMIQLHQRFQVFESEGTVFGSINQKDFKALLQIKAPDSLINKFEEYAGGLDNKIETNSLQITTLAKLRDTLLPRLMSGELRIPDIEKLVEDI